MSDVFAPPASSPPPDLTGGPTVSGASIGSEPWRVLEGRALAAKVGVGIVGAAAVPLLLMEIAFLAFGFNSELMGLVALAYLSLAALSFLLLIGSAVTWCMWSYRAAKNLRAINTEDDATLISATPGWVAGWWFVPIAQIWMPFKVHKELWVFSDFHADDTAPPSWIGLWWGFWIARLVLGQISWRIADRMPDLSIGLDALNSVATIAAAVLAIKLITDITKRQQATATRLGVR